MSWLLPDCCVAALSVDVWLVDHRQDCRASLKVDAFALLTITSMMRAILLAGATGLLCWSVQSQQGALNCGCNSVYRGFVSPERRFWHMLCVWFTASGPWLPLKLQRWHRMKTSCLKMGPWRKSCQKSRFGANMYVQLLYFLQKCVVPIWSASPLTI